MTLPHSTLAVIRGLANPTDALLQGCLEPLQTYRIISTSATGGRFLGGAPAVTGGTKAQGSEKAPWRCKATSR